MRNVYSKSDLLARRCRSHEGARAYLDTDIANQLQELTSWSHVGDSIERTYAFRDYYETIAFVNALAWMVHGEDHHPELVVGYNRCTVRFNTHSVEGVSENDFICAAKSDAIFGRVAAG